MPGESFESADSDLGGPAWGLRFGISNKLSLGAAGAGWWTMLCKEPDRCTLGSGPQHAEKMAGSSILHCLTGLGGGWGSAGAGDGEGKKTSQNGNKYRAPQSH